MRPGAGISTHFLDGVHKMFSRSIMFSPRPKQTMTAFDTLTAHLGSVDGSPAILPAKHLEIRAS